MLLFVAAFAAHARGQLPGIAPGQAPREATSPAWTPIAAPASENAALMAVWHAPASQDVFVAGQGGTVLRYDGSTWTSTAVDAKHDGETWSAMVSGTSRTLFGVGGSATGDVFAVGEKGTILRYSSPVEAVPR